MWRCGTSARYRKNYLRIDAKPVVLDRLPPRDSSPNSVRYFFCRPGVLPSRQPCHDGFSYVIDLTLDSDDDVAVVLSTRKPRISMKTEPTEQDLALIPNNRAGSRLEPSNTSVVIDVEVDDGFDTGDFDDEAEFVLAHRCTGGGAKWVQRTFNEIQRQFNVCGKYFSLARHWHPRSRYVSYRHVCRLR